MDVPSKKNQEIGILIINLEKYITSSTKSQGLCYRNSHYQFRKLSNKFNKVIGVVLAFEVTLKVFTPCLGVLHEIWGTWCMIIPWMV